MPFFLIFTTVDNTIHLGRSIKITDNLIDICNLFSNGKYDQLFRYLLIDSVIYIFAHIIQGLSTNTPKKWGKADNAPWGTEGQVILIKRNNLFSTPIKNYSCPRG